MFQRHGLIKTVKEQLVSDAQNLYTADKASLDSRLETRKRAALLTEQEKD
jgi:hypothetical protein